MKKSKPIIPTNLSYAELVKERDAWKQLAKLRADLLVCYRIGRHPSDKLLDSIIKLRERLND